MRQCKLVYQQVCMCKQLPGSSQIFLGKSDALSAFRMLLLSHRSWNWLILKATNPADGKTYYFVDKCLPFGSSISCSHYQCFSNALKHIMCVKYSIRWLINYLDDFLFIEITIVLCNAVVTLFLDMCKTIHLPVSLEKTEWAALTLIFLGNLLDGTNLMISIPLEKHDKAIRLLSELTDRKKATVKQLQVVTGYLNFLLRAIFVGRAFTRRIYAKFAANKKLRQYHHI